jgi:DNA-directed RNA polymerase specialized sigma24 family protein
LQVKIIMSKWDLSEEAFSRLLARLNADPALAGEQYEKLRARLIYFFERNNCRIPDELCDETINRVARKLEEGYEINDLFKFSSGVARLVLLEHWDDPKRKWVELDERLTSPEIVEREFDEDRLECMKECLQNLAPEERELITKNCITKKHGRAEMARAMGLTINAFRLRVFRVRTKLQRCYKRCVSIREESAAR